MRRSAALLALALTCAACTRPADQQIRATLQVAELLGGADTLFARAVKPVAFSFPRDHGPHPEFRTEWWYFTGNVATADGRSFGYQLTFFRSALTSDSVTTPADSTSRWRARDVYMAHFAVSDSAAGRLHAAERFGRGALGLAGANASPWRVWLNDWSFASIRTDAFPVRLRAASGDVAIDLVIDSGKPLVLQGEAGLSRKGPEPGNASHYYSFTRMPTSGTISSGGRSHAVQGESWLDREWSTSALGPRLEGWDWFALQLDDGTELMLYRLRRSDGTADPFSAGTHIDTDGTTRRFAAADFRLTPVRWWRSPLDRTRYPVAWRIEIPSLTLVLQAEAAFDAQELNLSVRYWEGSIRVAGRRADLPIAGRGYLEMTGYAQAPPRPR